MPDENVPQDPQIPKPPQPKLNSLDGFTNSPRPTGAVTPSAPGQPSAGPSPNSIVSPTTVPPKPDVSPPDQTVPNGGLSSGGVATPTVSGMAGLQPAVPQVQHAPLPPMPMPAPQSQTPSIVTHKKSRKKLWLGIVLLLVLVGLGAGYAFAFYLPNTPANIYKSSLTNSGLAVDKLIQYSRSRQQVHYKTTSFSGKLTVKSPQFSFDASASGDISKDNGQIALAADAMSQKVSTNLRYVTADGKDSPDVYLQVSGVKTLLNQEGLGPLAKYDNKWIVIDHTLVDSYKSSLQKEAGQMSGDAQAQMDKMPTDAQVNDAVDKVQAVNKQYIFTADPAKAVLKQEQYVGKDTVNGRAMYHYKVGYNKEHLKAYVAAVGQALDSSQLNDWAKKVDNGKNISDELNFKDAGAAIDKYDANYTFDMWADVKTKLVSKLLFTDTKNKDNTFAISQNFTGGVLYPFGIEVHSKDDSGNPSSFTFGFSVNSSTNEIKMNLNGNAKDSSGTSSFDGNLDITPSNKTVVVAAPAGAVPIMDLLKAMGLSSTDLQALTGGPAIPACKAGDTKCLQKGGGINPGAVLSPANCPAQYQNVCAQARANST